MNGPWGRRGTILSHFGWTWDHLLYEVPWFVVCRMLADAPRHDIGPGEKDEGIEVTEDNAESIAAMLNGSC